MCAAVSEKRPVLRMKKPKKSSAALKVLFIGNSFTARNDLPALVARLAAASGRRLDHRLISVGGASLRTHWNKGNALGQIQNGGYDCIVLQEQSTLPVKNARRMHENVRLFDTAIRVTGARTVLYLTWARRSSPENQAAITEAYTAIARELGASVIPAGVAWQAFERKHDRPVLYDSDGSHPTLAGSYLAACCAAATLFDRSVVDADVEIEGLTRDQRRLLTDAASRAVTE
jgi:hypothetical protein